MKIVIEAKQKLSEDKAENGTKLNDNEREELSVVAKGATSSPRPHADPFIGETQEDINQKKEFLALIVA